MNRHCSRKCKIWATVMGFVETPREFDPRGQTSVAFPLSGTTLKNFRNMLAGIARFSGTSLLGIVTFFHGLFNFSIPLSSSLNSLLAALYTSLIHTGYCSLLRVVVERDSTHLLRKAEVSRENMILSVPANLSMCCRDHL